ncbi:MAG: alpha-glucosidase [Puniceicoccaceae bacterium 5H]|nr:MAG: alpha-glucosidase [Puniceicoccaceae bacterium 5H]
MKALFTTLLAASLWHSLPAAEVRSPDGQLQISCDVDAQGVPHYAVDFQGEPVVLPSTLGFTFVDQEPLQGGLAITDTQTRDFDETWEMPWGERREVENRFHELRLTFTEDHGAHRTFDVVFRAYDDGIAFRYVFPEQDGWPEAKIAEEHTQFRLDTDPMCWWIPGDWDSYEHLYNQSRLSEIDAFKAHENAAIMRSIVPHNAVNTPVTVQTDAGVYLSFHEAALTDYAGMTLRVDPQGLALESCLVGSERTDYKVRRQLPFETPWRTIQIADNAPALIDSSLIVNLNEPSRIGEVTDYFQPMKYVGIWWDMHIRTKTWAYEGGQHGATTAYAKELIDFAAANNLHGILVEGWNTGWENWMDAKSREGIFDFTTAYPDYDLAEVVRYGKSKGVELIMHHETSAAVTTYNDRIDAAFGLMKDLGIHAVKTGYVGDIYPQGEYHHGQWMVNHYRSVLEQGAAHQVAINAHEPIKPTGIRRTYPNAIAREGVRGQEFDAWSPGGNPPNHVPTVAFTRMLAGPIDYTPGIFNVKLAPYQPDYQVNSTLAKQLAMYVVVYSPIQMVPDLMEAYTGEPAFQFIRDVAVDWEQSHTLNGEIGAYVTIARQERGGDRWFIGSLTNEEPRALEVKLDFLDPDRTYRAVIYGDASDAHWDKNPTAYTISRRTVTRDDVLELKLAPGGGAAVALTPLNR